jgi:hypothetical protein
MCHKFWQLRARRKFRDDEEWSSITLGDTGSLSCWGTSVLMRAWNRKIDEGRPIVCLRL